MLRRFLREKNLSMEVLWNEVWNLFKFGVVGLSSLAIDVGVYALLSRVLWVDGPRTGLSVISTSISACFNFLMHRSWTFRTQAFSISMVIRYLSVLVAGTAINAVLFYVGHEILHLYDILVKIGSVFLVAGGSYTLHRWYTFHPKHEA